MKQALIMNVLTKIFVKFKLVQCDKLEKMVKIKEGFNIFAI